MALWDCRCGKDLHPFVRPVQTLNGGAASKRTAHLTFGRGAQMGGLRADRRARYVPLRGLRLRDCGASLIWRKPPFDRTLRLPYRPLRGKWLATCGHSPSRPRRPLLRPRGLCPFGRVRIRIRIRIRIRRTPKAGRRRRDAVGGTRLRPPKASFRIRDLGSQPIDAYAALRTALAPEPGAAGAVALEGGSPAPEVLGP